MKNGIIIKRNTIFTSELAAMNQGKDEAVATAFCESQRNGERVVRFWWLEWKAWLFSS